VSAGAATLRRSAQTFGFLRKEAIDVGRQPRLVLMLVVGPFLILLAFGLGYRRSPDPYRTLFVTPAGTLFASQVQNYAQELGKYVRFAGTTEDAAGAESRLRRGDVDVVVEFPADPLGTVLSGHQASVGVLHTRLDPVEQTAIDFAARLAVDSINSQILASIVTQGQQAARPLGDVFSTATAAVHSVDSAVAAADQAGAVLAAKDLRAQVGQLRSVLERTMGIAGQLVDTAPGSLAGPASTASTTLGQLEDKVAALQSTLSGGALDTARQQLADIDKTMTTVHENFDAFTTVQADVLVRPFVSQVTAVGDGDNTITDFYAPAAVVLLVQQFGVAFGAVTFVRERSLGTVEMYRAGPVSAGPLLLGKYLGYFVIGGVVAALLVTLVVQLLGVPLHGDPAAVTVVLGLVLLASVGLGFMISLMSRTDTQAVQYSMIVLLASLFFSGFFLAVERLAYPARIISWLLPATFGITLLRDVMLRGISLRPSTTLALCAYTVVVVLLSYLGTRRLLAAR
jgi:ABC-2 type transport system permease protein